MKMHAGQAEVTVQIVERLVRQQFPEWAELPTSPLASDGTVHALFRLGDDIVLRFPLEAKDDEARRASLLRVQETARAVAGQTTLQVPEPLALGRPGPDYAGWWTAYRWISGEPVGLVTLHDPDRLAEELAHFVLELHSMDTAGRGWDGRSRGGPLTTRSDGVVDALRRSEHLMDVPAVAQTWQTCLRAPASRGPEVWIHADLMPGNLLTRDGGLAAVIDLDTVCIGDPAVDLMPAWNLLPSSSRAVYRAALGVDDATWERGRGWAIAQAIIALPYYVDTNPAMAETARRTLTNVLE